MKAFPEAVKGDQAKGNGQGWDFSLGTRIKKSKWVVFWKCLEITWIFLLKYTKQNKPIQFTVMFVKGLDMAYTLNAILKYLEIFIVYFKTLNEKLQFFFTWARKVSFSEKSSIRKRKKPTSSQSGEKLIVLPYTFYSGHLSREQCTTFQ